MRRLLLVLAVACAAAAPADAATRWHAPEVVSAAGAANPAVRMDARGRALVVWQQVRQDGVHELRYAWRDPRAAFGRPRVLGVGSAPFSYPEPSVALAPAGVATAAYLARDGRIAVRRAGAGESFGDPVHVGEGAPRRSPPAVATDDEGRAVVVWSESHGQDDSRVVAVSVSRDGAVGTPAELGAGQIPTVAVNPSGAAVVAWADFNGRPHAAVRPAGGAFGPPSTPPVRTPGWPRAAIDARGRAVVAASHFVPTGTGGTTFSVADEAGAFGSQHQLDTGGIVEQLLAEPSGAVDFASNQPDGDRAGGRFAFASRRAGGELVGPDDISGPEACGPHLAVARGGDLLAAWTAGCTATGHGTTSRAAVRLRTAGSGRFGEPVLVGTPGAFLARGAVTDGDEAVVVYTHGPTQTVHAVVREDRGDDPLPPVPSVDIRLPESVPSGDLDALAMRAGCRRGCRLRPVARLHAGGRVLRGRAAARRVAARRRTTIGMTFGDEARALARAAAARGERPFVTVSLAVRGASPRTHTLTRRAAVARAAGS